MLLVMFEIIDRILEAGQKVGVLSIENKKTRVTFDASLMRYVHSVIETKKLISQNIIRPHVLI